MGRAQLIVAAPLAPPNLLYVILPEVRTRVPWWFREVLEHIDQRV